MGDKYSGAGVGSVSDQRVNPEPLERDLPSPQFEGRSPSRRRFNADELRIRLAYLDDGLQV